MPDYRSYRLSVREWLQVVFVGSAALFVIGWLFYRSLWAGVFFLPLLLVLGRSEESRRQEKRTQLLSRQFQDGMQAVAAALSAGYSVENAFGQAERELARIHGKHGLLTREFALLRRRLSLSWTAEEALQDLAERSGIEDIRELAQVFNIAKRSGGSLPEILRQTVYTLAEKERLQEDIRTMITSKRLEFYLMCLMPPAMLAYVGLGSREFLAPLYEGLRGRVLMTGCLLVYLLAIWLGRRILRVEV